MDRKFIIRKSAVLVILLISISVSSCFKFKDYEKEQEEMIDNFVEYSDYNYVEKSSGIYYAEVEPGVGVSPTLNDTVSLHWSTFLLSDYLVESNFGEGMDPVDFIIGSGELLEGVEEAVKYLKPGGTAYVIVPSDLGYGDYNIYFDPYTPLCFFIKLVEVKYYNNE